MRRAPQPLPRLLVALVSAICLALVACGGSALNGDVFKGRGYAYRLGPVSEKWRQLNVSHADLAFRDEAADATVAVHGRCRGDVDDIPLASLTQHLFLRFTERRIERQEVVPFDKREAMHTVLEAKLDGVRMKFDVWVMKKDGCVYDIYYMAPAAKYGRGSPEFTRFVGGFTTVRDGS